MSKFNQQQYNLKRQVARSKLSLRQLINQLNAADFTIQLVTEQKLLKYSALPNTRSRSATYVQLTNARARAVATKIYGLYVPDEQVIMINQSLSLEERVKTMLHELIHLYHPKLSETDTERSAIQLYHRLSDSELGYLEFMVS